MKPQKVACGVRLHGSGKRSGPNKDVAHTLGEAQRTFAYDLSVSYKCHFRVPRRIGSLVIDSRVRYVDRHPTQKASPRRLQRPGSWHKKGTFPMQDDRTVTIVLDATELDHFRYIVREEVILTCTHIAECVTLGELDNVDGEGSHWLDRGSGDVGLVQATAGASDDAGVGATDGRNECVVRGQAKR